MKILIFLIARSSVWSTAKNHFSTFIHCERPLPLWADPIKPVGWLLELDANEYDKWSHWNRAPTGYLFTIKPLSFSQMCLFSSEYPSTPVPEIHTRNAGAVIAKTYSEVACAILAQHLRYSLWISLWACAPFLLAYSPTNLLHSLAKDPYLIFKDNLLPNIKTIKYQIWNIKIQSKFYLKPARTISNWKVSY